LNTEEIKGTVLRIERSSIHDGAGFRTVVFLKGCPLSCLWCSTPEGKCPEIETFADKTYGKIMSVAETIKEIEKDSIFFFHSGGGLTLSGGEPLMQDEFAGALLCESKKRGINTAMETCLYADYDTVKKLMKYTDTLYADLKFINPDKHLEYCGQNNTIILDNIRKITDENSSSKIIIRVPVIPTVNDSTEELYAIADFCKSLKSITDVELLPYHRLGISTYEKMSLKYPLADIAPQKKEEFEAQKELFKKRMQNI